MPTLTPTTAATTTKKSSVRVQRASPEDVKHLDTIHSFIHRAYRSDASWTRESHIVKGERIDHSSLRDILLSGDPPLFLAFSSSPSSSQDAPVGCVEVEFNDGEAIIGLLAVDPLQQSSGIGSALFRTAEAYIRDSGMTQSAVWVLHQREDLKPWYIRMGYQPTGRTLDFPPQYETFEPGCYFDIMIKQLV
ncbi:MAG: acyl-CoA N-acyltransferase [Piptocephalis tieghemiana]|nr:MAG: acyl-CoA N-acyltransferase [Piptocephalis tieghemiana]